MPAASAHQAGLHVIYLRTFHNEGQVARPGENMSRDGTLCRSCRRYRRRTCPYLHGQAAKGSKVLHFQGARGAVENTPDKSTGWSMRARPLVLRSISPIWSVVPLIAPSMVKLVSICRSASLVTASLQVVELEAAAPKMSAFHLRQFSELRQPGHHLSQSRVLAFVCPGFDRCQPRAEGCGSYQHETGSREGCRNPTAGWP